MPFTPSNQLREAVNEKSKTKAREALQGYILSDVNYTSHELDHAVDYLLQNCLNPFEPYSDEETGSLDRETTHWNKNYQGRVQLDLRDNFSKERLEHWKKVAEFVGNQYHEAAQDNEAKKNKPNPPHPTVNPILLVGIAVGVVAVATIVLLIK